MSATSAGNEREVGGGRLPSDEDDGKAMPLARAFRALAKDEVRQV